MGFGLRLSGLALRFGSMDSGFWCRAEVLQFRVQDVEFCLFGSVLVVLVFGAGSGLWDWFWRSGNFREKFKPVAM